MKRLVVAMSGASGAPIGVALLQAMRQFSDWETHVVVSAGAEATLPIETNYTLSEVQALATKTYHNGDIGAAIASGTFRTEGMVIVPCSMKTAAGIAIGYSDNLILRAADVTIKERRRLVLAVREAPLSPIHLRNMLTLAELGAVIMPPVLSFYNAPATIDDHIRHLVGKIIGNFGLDMPGFKRWGE